MKGKAFFILGFNEKGFEGDGKIKLVEENQQIAHIPDGLNFETTLTLGKGWQID